MLKKHPLIQQLSKLRESSKEAVADANVTTQDDLKNYLHIERPVERDLRQVIEKSSSTEQGCLVMVCGNVGDGKSHLLSKLNQDVNFRPLLSRFDMHNDATESFSPDQTCIDTLCEILSPFSDSRIRDAKDKLLLAINLGTLSNFLEERGAEYTQLAKFVDDHGIINPEKFSVKDNYIQGSRFQFVNFTNHHFYSLSAEGVNASLFEELLAKVVEPSNENPIYRAYTSLLDEEWSLACPVRINFETLSVEKNRKVISRILVECMLKEKLIISFRQILNFVYDILVPYELSTLEMGKYRTTTATLSAELQLSYHISNYIFERPGISRIFQSFYRLDPAVRRFEELDERAIRIFTSTDKMNVFLKDFPDLSDFLRLNVSALSGDSSILYKSFLRLHYFYRPGDKLYSDDYFDAFARSLYFSNVKDAKGLKDINELVKTAALLWNGSIQDEDKMMYDSVSKHANYRLFRNIQLKPILPALSAKIAFPELNQFLTEVKVSFKHPMNNGGEHKPFSIDVDYSLFVLFQMVKRGYRPNRLDRNSFVNFVTMVDSLTYEQSENEMIFIDEINIGDPIDYTLKLDDYGDFKFKKF